MRRKPKKPSVYAFIDSQNLNLGVQKAGWKLDWRKFRQFLLKEYGVTHAYLFIGYLIENESLYESMHDAGYLVVLKPTLDIQMTVAAANEEAPAEGHVAQPKPLVKGNIDADLVLYTMKELPHYDKAIIVSGDGDFFGLIEYLVEQKKLLHILTPNWQYSSLLKEFEPYMVRLDQLRSQLAYRNHRVNNSAKSK